MLHHVCILCMMHQREALQQQTQELEALVRSYMQRMGKCPISGRGVALEEELEALVQVKTQRQTSYPDSCACSRQRAPSQKARHPPYPPSTFLDVG
jgi:hypothetical protein